MGKIYINCARCGKDLECEELDDVYTSKIDDTFLCKECFEEEKPEYIQQLKQQLVEKDKEIKKLNWQLKDKDFIIKNLNHSLSVAPNANAGQRARIDELTKIVKEKDKEIEKLKQQYTILENENGKLTTELIVGKYKKAQKEVSFGKQLTLQELEKVKAKVRDVSGALALCEVEVQIDQQIKELKGE